MKKLFALLLALALVCATALAEATPEPLEPPVTPEPTLVPGVNLPPLSIAFITPEPTPEPTPTPTPDPVEVARQALIADSTDVWYLNAFVLDGSTFAPELFGSEMTLSLMEDGKAEADYGEDRRSGAGEWDVQDERIIVTIGDTTRVFFLTEDDTLVTDIDGGSMVLGREKTVTEAFAPAEPIEAALEQFAGEWEAYQIGVNGAYFDVNLFGQSISATVEGTTITVTGYVFTGISARATYEDGALGFTGADDEGGMFDSVTAQLLADDSLCLTLNAGRSGGFTLIMRRVDPLK